MNFRLMTLGGLRLEADGDVVTGPPAQRRRLALLALLTASEQRKLTREKAFGYLWPEQPTSRARHLLSESLYVLRRLMGEDVISNARDELRLNSAVLWSDVAAFQDGLAAGRSEEAVSLYRGPFLDGFHLDDAEEFDNWVEALRDRTARQYARALESLALKAAACGDLVGAAEWWQRLATHDPYSSRVAIECMEALAGAGERARAIQFATRHVARLRQDLGVEPDPAFQPAWLRLQAPTPIGAKAAEPVATAASGRGESDLHASRLSSQAPAETRPHALSDGPPRGGLGLHAWVGLGIAAAGAMAAVGALVAALNSADDPASPRGAVKALSFEPGAEIAPSFSPDGRYVAYTAGTPSRIYIRQHGSRPLPLVTPDSGPPQARPRWSPDGTRIVFDAGRRIFVVPALGGVPREIVASGWSPTWAPDGRRIAYVMGDTVLTIDVEGGRPVPLVVINQPAELAWSPDGRWIAATAGNDVWNGLIHVGNIAPSRIVLVSTGDGRIVQVTDRRTMNVAPAWAPDSRKLLFISNRAGARDIYMLRLSSAGKPEGEPARLSTGLDAHSLALSPSGDRIVYATYRSRINIWSVRIPSAGAPVNLDSAVVLTTGNQTIESISVSPDRQWIYFTSDRAGNSDIWRLSLAGGEPVQVTSHPADDFAPEQSPDGEWLVYYSLRGGTRDLWLRPTKSGESVRLTRDQGEEHDPRWSPDGNALCYGQASSATSLHSVALIRRQGSRWSDPIVPRDARGKPNRFLGCTGWLPDGRHMVVQDDKRSMIALFPADGGNHQVIYSGDPARGRPMPIWVRVKPGTGDIYFRDWASAWVMERGKPVPREIVRFDHPQQVSTRIEMDATGEHLFFSLGESQGDLFVAEFGGLITTRR